MLTYQDGGERNVDFSETLQQLRKQKGLTQDELAKALFVSRTAISKWESGRGFPNIDSLKAIAAFFAVSLDDLLSGETILAIAEEEHKQEIATVRDLVFGLLDCGMALLFVLPFFGQQAGSVVQDVSLLALTDIQPYLKVIYIAVIAAMAFLGVLILALQTCRHALWVTTKFSLSLTLSLVGVTLFILGQQPYAAIFTLVFLIIKALMLIKHR